MAPALTSDNLLNDKGKRMPLSNSRRRENHCASSKNVASVKQENLNQNGRRRRLAGVNGYANNGWSRKPASNNDVGDVPNGQNIQAVDTTMNNVGSKSKPTIHVDSSSNSGILRQPVHRKATKKRKLQKRMCVKNLKSGEADEISDLSNGTHELHEKSEVDTSDSSQKPAPTLGVSGAHPEAHSAGDGSAVDSGSISEHDAWHTDGTQAGDFAGRDEGPASCKVEGGAVLSEGSSLSSSAVEASTSRVGERPVAVETPSSSADKEPTARAGETSSTVDKEPVASPVVDTAGVQAEQCARHALLVKRLMRLLTRVRRLQLQQAVAHGRRQVGGLVAHLTAAQRSQHPGAPAMAQPAETAESALDLRDAQNMSTSTLVNLVQQWQAQHTLPKPAPGGGLDAGLGEELCADLEQLAGHLGSNARHLNAACDADATASSSGGESCDEADYDVDWTDKPRPPLAAHAEWGWSAARAGLAARWTWLQAQVSDLEYRIRQQTELTRHLRASKGAVLLSSHAPPASSRLECLQASGLSPASVSPLLASLQQQSRALHRQLGAPLYTPPSHPPAAPANSTLAATLPSATPPLASAPSLAAHATTCLAGDSGDAEEEVAARCRPALLGKYRKRRLLRASWRHEGHKRARLLHPAAGDPGATQGGGASVVGVAGACCAVTPRSLAEAAARLDHAYHQVLSLPQDVPLSLRLSGVLRAGDWQHSAALPLPVNRRGFGDKKSSTTANQVLTRIKNKYATERALHGGGLPGSSPDRKRFASAALKKKAALTDAAALRRRRRALRSGRLGGGGLQDDSAAGRGQRRHNQHAYDINNIVIPNSMLASTRLERIQYKEILTPSWRELPEMGIEVLAGARGGSPATLQMTPGDEVCSTAPAACVPECGDAGEEEQEDVSEASFLSRHQRAELAERARFLHYSSSTATTAGSRANAPQPPLSASSATSLASSDTTPASVADASRGQEEGARRRRPSRGARVSDSGMRTSDSGIRASEIGMRTSDSGIRVGEIEMRTSDSGMRACESGGTGAWPCVPVPRGRSTSDAARRTTTSPLPGARSASPVLLRGGGEMRVELQDICVAAALRRTDSCVGGAAGEYAGEAWPCRRFPLSDYEYSLLFVEEPADPPPASQRYTLRPSAAPPAPSPEPASPRGPETWTVRSPTPTHATDSSLVIKLAKR